MNVSNAPSLYSSNSYTSYQSYAQDWVYWVNNNYLDNVQVQSYVNTPTFFGSILDFIPSLVTNMNKVFPCFAVKPGSSTLTNEEVYQFVNITRSKGYKGNSVWYYADLISYFPNIKANIFSSKSYPPYSSMDWRELYKIVLISDNSNAVRTGNWIPSTIPGYNGSSIYANPGTHASIEYFLDIPANGIYEVYAFTVVGSNRTDSAKYTVYDSSGNVSTKYINQSLSLNKRWYKLGDYLLRQGRQLVAKVTNEGIQSGEVVSADAIMICLNRRLSPNTSTAVENDESIIQPDEKSFNLKNFPNPFNGQTTLSFSLNSLAPYKMNIYNIVGEKILEVDNQPENIGLNHLDINLASSQITSGIYLVNLIQSDKKESIKIIYSK